MHKPQPSDAASRTTHEIDYFALPPDVQRAVAAGLQPDGPAVLSEAPSKEGYCLGRLLGAAALMSMALPSAAGRYIPGTGATWNWGILTVVAVLVVAALYLFLSALYRYRLAREVRFRPGRYLFGLTAIDARDARMTVTDLYGAQNITLVHSSFNFINTGSALMMRTRDGTRVRFNIGSRRRAEQACEQFLEAQEEARSVMAGNDDAAALRLDPLWALRKREWRPFSGPARPAADLPPGWLRNRAATALVAGVAMALLLQGARFYNTDRQHYQAVIKSGSSLQLYGYLEHGWRHKPQVQAVLPGVMFEEARRARSIPRFEALQRRFPAAGLDQAIAAEIALLSQPPVRAEEPRVPAAEAGSGWPER